MWFKTETVFEKYSHLLLEKSIIVLFTTDTAFNLLELF